MLYLDTSALLPYYREEAASGGIQTLLSQQTRPVLISQLTKVEFASVLARWVRMGELTEPQASRVESALHDDIMAGRFMVRRIEPPHFERAFQWLLTRKTSLRVLDALHLACAEGLGATMVTLDKIMGDAAQHYGLQVLSIE